MPGVAPNPETWMPFVVQCPTCRCLLTVHELQIGTVVACPTCHCPLMVAVPNATGPTAERPHEEPFAIPDDQPAPAPRRRGWTWSLVSWMIFWAAVAGAIFAAGLPNFDAAMFMAAPITLLAASVYNCLPDCPGCGQRLFGFAWDRRRKDGGADLRYKHNTRRCNRCGCVFDRY